MEFRAFLKSPEGSLAAFQLRFFGVWWLAITLFHFLSGDDSLAEAAWKPRYFLLGGLFFIGLRLVVPCVAFLNRCNEGFHQILAFVPEQFAAWKTKSALSFVLLFSIVGVLLFRREAAASWTAFGTLLMATVVGSLYLWVLMCCVDSLQKWAKTPARRAVGLLILLLMLTVFFVVFMSGALWLAGKYA